MIHIGHEHFIVRNKIVAITEVTPAPLRRIRQNLEDQDRMLDCTNGRKSRSLIFLIGGLVVISSVKPETLTERMKGA